MQRISASLIGLISVVLISAWSARASAQGFQPPQDIPFTARHDGTEQRYVLLLPDDFRSDVPHDLMIALHGHGSDRWQFVKDERPECKGAREMAASRGMIYVSPDYRAKTSWMGPAAEADLLQILDDIRGRFRIGQVILCGGSMGATSALAFAAMHPESIDAVVALNGTANMVEYTGFADAIAESYGGSKTERPEVYRQRSAELSADKLSMPMALTTGGKDTLVPPESVLRLAESLKRRSFPVLLIHRPEGGHSTDLTDTRAAFQFVFEQLDKKREP